MSLIEKPSMYDECIEKVKKVLLGLNKEHFDILEWGSGNSTMYFTDFLKQNGISYSWDTVEHNKKWADYIETETKKFGLNNINIHYCAEKELYVNLPLSLNKKYDVIFIDGGWRRDCLQVTKDCLKKDGVVFLHDARRYDLGKFPFLKGEKLTRKTWCGRLYINDKI